MMYVRTTKTKSGATAVQIVSYIRRKTIINKHIGSANTEEQLEFLLETARKYILKQSGQRFLLQSQNKDYFLNKYKYTGIKYNFAYEILEDIYKKIGFHKIENFCLKDFSIIRVFDPSSKQKSLELLNTYFDLSYSKGDMYRKLKALSGQQASIEKTCIKSAEKSFNFNFNMVFYDVTTLYFESFEEDELRKCGFSKDNKHNQPQIVIGLIVNDEGFPISVQIFEGSKFEGHTLLPSILRFKKQYTAKDLTVIADAAMISLDNIKNLRTKRLKYIVGARLGNIKAEVLQKLVRKLNQVDGNTLRKRTKYGMMICEFSMKRYKKDMHEFDKQISKAKQRIKNPSKLLSRFKYIQKSNNSDFELNKKLIEKNKKLLGIKGYYTNLRGVSDDKIINHYHNLWKIEKAFRISKSDLNMRPIFSRKEDMIRIHILICFVSLAISKYVELNGHISIKRFCRLLKSVTRAQMINTITGEKSVMQNEIPAELKNCLRNLSLSY